MKAKKAKELVNELIGDILNDDESSPPSSTDDKAEVPSETKSLNLTFEPHIPKGTSPRVPAPMADETIRLGESKILPKFERQAQTLQRSTSITSMSTENALSQSESLRVAQNHIFELEHEIERLRRENEQLAAAGETIRKRTNELIADNDFKTRKLTELQERLASEKEILEASLKAKDRELKEIKMKIDEYEMRLSTNLQKIRVRERELENRLELVKMESTALVRNKDEIILDLKRQIDQFTAELESYRNKGQELNKQINDKQETLRRTVRALRLALTMLEGGGEENNDPLKKAK
jgi:chromosome segregation ATPase